MFQRCDRVDSVVSMDTGVGQRHGGKSSESLSGRGAWPQWATAGRDTQRRAGHRKS